MGRRRYSDETKAAVMAALLAGQSITEVARAYRIPEGTVKGWSANRVTPDTTTSSTVKREIGDLLLEYLRTVLETLSAQQKQVFSDPKWLRLQNAADLAVLHGVSADKAIRLLEALAGPTEEDEEE